ncbi:MAG: DUF1800 domain-containing protein [Rudaea sp.]
MPAQQLSHAPDLLFHDGYNGLNSVGTANISDSDASRFLAQATFGPTDTDIANLRTLGYTGWLNQQFAATPSYETTDLPGKTNSAYLNWISNVLKEQIGQNNRQEAWFLGALGGKDPQFPSNSAYNHTDQLRQRVAFALSEIFVVSDQNATLDGYAQGMAWMYDLLVKDAFGNYRTLLNDVTLSPAMGVYLNMMGNRRADLSNNVHPDENYGREVNQLFSIGLVMLNLDGTPQQPLTSTYTQSTVTNFSHVFTGWNWASCDADGYDAFTWCFTPYDTPSDFLTPMVAYDRVNYPQQGDPSYHDNGTDPVNDISNKQLLNYPGAVNGGVLADGGTAASDLGSALDNIFHHPNVGPFISKQLIQRLVTSNPSPAYVQRVATVFNNDGTGTRGNLKAVVQAILLDPEARYGQWQNPATFGKLREPVIVLTHYWRAMAAKHLCGQNIAATSNSAASMYANQPYRYAGYSTAWSAGQTTTWGVGVDQASQDAPTVFNFFKPGYLPPGELTSLGLVGPEFQISTDSVIANTTNTFASYALYGNYDYNDTCDPNDTIGDVVVNHSQDLALAGSGSGGVSDPADKLVDEYSKRFMSGQMSPYMRNQLLTDLNPINHNWAQNGQDWRLQRVYRALYLVLTSPEYMIQK